MTVFIAELYLAAVAAAGFVIGLSLHVRLRRNNQISIKAPSPFRDRARRPAWFADDAKALV